MRSRVRFPFLPWEFSLKGWILAVTMVWVGWQNLGLRALLALHLPISPLTSSGQRNCTSWASQPQKSVTLLPCPGERTTKSTRTCGGIGQKKKYIGLPRFGFFRLLGGHSRRLLTRTLLLFGKYFIVLMTMERAD